MSDDDAGPAAESAVAEQAVEPPHAEAAGGSHPGASGSRTLPLIALALSIAAAVGCLLLLVPAWNSRLSVSVTIVLALAAVICAVVVLERGRKSAMAIGAAVVALVAGVAATAAAMPAPDLYAHVYGYADDPGPAPDCPTPSEAPDGTDPDFWEGAFYATERGAEAAGSAPLPFETKVPMSQTATQLPAMSMTVGRPVDVTQAAADASVPAPEQGVYLAVAVTYADPDEQAFSCLFSPAFPSSWWLADSGEEFELATVSIPDFPTLEEGGIADPSGDSLVYYDIFDVTPTAVAGGSYYTVLLTPEASQQFVSWGAD